MPDSLFTDEDILRGLLSGNRQEEEAASRYLHQLYRGMVIKLVQVSGGNAGDDVEDVLDTAIAVLVQHVRNGTYQSEKSGLQTYFYGIARNTQHNRLRERRSRKEIYVEELPQDQSLLTLNDVEKRMNTKDAHEKVAAAIQELDPICQQVLIQYWLEEKSMRGIAKGIGMSEDAVKQRNRRCMKKLRGLLKNDFENWFNE